MSETDRVRKFKDRTLAEVMAREVITLQIGERTSLADLLMKQHPIHHVPVLDGKILKGIISRSDLYRNMLSCYFIETEEEQHEFLDRFLDISAVMTQDPIALSPEDTLGDALAVILDRRVGSVPVVNEQNELVGIITEYDLMQTMREAVT